jgi:hypothetical protein
MCIRDRYTEVQKIHAMLEDLMQKGWIQTIPQSILQDALQWALQEIGHKTSETGGLDDTR